MIFDVLTAVGAGVVGGVCAWLLLNVLGKAVLVILRWVT